MVENCFSPQILLKYGNTTYEYFRFKVIYGISAEAMIENTFGCHY